MFLIACVAVSFTASATPSWEINSKGAIQWNVDKAQLPHKDHVEMSVEEKSLYNEATIFVEIDGMFRVVSIFDEAVEVERIIFPS